MDFPANMESNHSSRGAFLHRIVGKVHQCIQLVLHFLFKVVNCGKKEELPPVTNLLLLTPSTSLAAKIRKKKLKSVDLVETYISRIKEVNPYINAVVAERYDQALEEAKIVDKLVASGQKSEEQFEREMPFLGVPFTFKDLFAVSGLPLTAGLVSRKDALSDQDCEVVKLMKEAGAIPIASTNTSELAMWIESHNRLYGRTLNPHDSSRGVGGSSGGEGAILAAAGSVIGLGNDIAGSIRIPACFNGIFGHKPTAGIVSNEGSSVTVNPNLDCYLSAGPMCRYATDLLPMMKVLSARSSDKLHLDVPVKLDTLKIYYMEDAGDCGLFTKVHQDIRNAMAKALRHFENAYRIKPQKLQVKAMKHAVDICFANVFEKGGFKAAERLRESKCPVNNLFIEFLLWMIGQSKHTFHLLSLLMFEKIYSSLHQNRRSAALKSGSDALHLFQTELGDDGVFLYPTWPEPAPHHNELLFKPFDFGYVCLFNILGLPVTHCPLGLSSEGLPVGIQIVSNVNNDRLCLAVAVELEKAFGGWVCPCPIAE